MKFGRGKKALALAGGLALGMLAVPTTTSAAPPPPIAVSVDYVCNDGGASIVASAVPAPGDGRSLLMFVEIVDLGDSLRYDDYFDLDPGTYTFPDDGLEDGDTDVEGPYADGTYRVIVEVEDTEAPQDDNDAAFLLVNLEIDCSSAPPTTAAPTTTTPAAGVPTTAAAGGSNTLPETGASSTAMSITALLLVGLGTALLLVRRRRTA